MLALEKGTVESSELVEQTFKFWFNDHEHIRSPFPKYIHTKLRDEATEKFFEWASGLDDRAKDEIDDAIVGERFEEIIFETAMGLILTDDERITILYPFLPRLGDSINETDGNGNSPSKIIDRSIVKDGDHSYLSVKLERNESNETWQTRFELPPS